MKFMKLGSKPDAFQTDGKNSRYVASELASDITINVDNVKFYLHKFPLLSKSAHLQKLVAAATDEQCEEIHISDFPGGQDAFEICAKFCYGMIVTLNAHNVVVARCAAEYLEMHEGIEKGNLIYKIEVFLSSSIFRSWKDSIIVLQTTKSLALIPEELKLVGRCVDAIASKACVDVSRVDWSYTYNRKKLSEENNDNGDDPNWNSVVRRSVPVDWWVEDLCELEVELYKRVLVNIKSKAMISSEVIGEALKAYAYRRLPGFGKGMIDSGDVARHQMTVDLIAWLLPSEKGSISCSFLLRLLKAANLVGSSVRVKDELVRRIGQQLEAASVSDILIRAGPPEEDEEAMMYDVGVVKRIVEEFLRQEDEEEDRSSDEIELLDDADKIIIPKRRRRPGILSDASKLMVAKLIDGYLAEIAKDRNLGLSVFVELAEMVSGISRPAHDGIYRAIDMFLKEHPGISKSDRKRICKLMDCRKLSADACAHAVQNERLPLRVVVQVLFFEQARAAASSGSSTPDLPKSIKDLSNASHGSSRSANTNTNTEEDWDAVATAEELRALRGELAALRLSNGERNGGGSKSGGAAADKAAANKMRGMLKSKKIFARLWSGKGGGNGENNSGSDSSESLGSVVHEETKSTPSRNHRHSVS